MARSALLLVPFAALTIALVPPCLPDLGPEFCPATVPDDAQTASREPVAYPELTQQDAITSISSMLDKTRMEAELRALTDPAMLPSRYCNSSTWGPRAHEHVAAAVEEILANRSVADAGGGVAPRVEASLVPNGTPQMSYVVKVMVPEGKGEGEDEEVGESGVVRNTIVVGAHMDSINHEDAQNASDDMVAPGADDNGSGTVVLMEVLRLMMPMFAHQPVKNEVHFHWYAAEEIGLVGSQAVFEAFKNESRPVKAMLNLDMVGFSGAHQLSSPVIAVQSDGFVDVGLTDFTKMLVHRYSKAEPGLAKCGYACSDHASASRAGYPAAMIGESSYIKGNLTDPNGYPFTHTANDTMDHIDFDYMMEFAKITLAFVLELAYHDFDKV